MIAQRHSRWIVTSFSILLLLSSSSSFAVGYGIYDARTQGLGGTSVAMANTNNAYFYNPSILAFHYEDEDHTRDGRVTPVAILEYSEATKSAYELVDKDVDTKFDNAVAAYNALPTTQRAADALVFSSELEDLAEKIQDQDLNIDSYVGFGVSEVGELGGGSFFIGSRIIGGGTTDIPESDRELFDQYNEVLEYFASDGQSGVFYPELVQLGCPDALDQRFPVDGDGNRLLDPLTNSPLINENCDLNEPSDEFTSSAQFRGALITEVGVSSAKLWQWRNFLIAGGFTPKVMMLKTFDEDRRVSDDDFNVDTTLETELFFNLDLGVSIQYAERYRLGLAVKDVLQKSFKTELENTIELTPRSRLGFSYMHDYFIVGADIDLEKIESFSENLARQDFSLGVEVPFYNIVAVRAGYRVDTKGNFKNKFNLGLGFSWRRFSIDAAYSSGDKESSYALQGGFAF